MIKTQCLNSHDVEPGDAFCPTCGTPCSAVPDSSVYPSVDGIAGPARPSPTEGAKVPWPRPTWSTWGRKKRIAVTVAVVAVLAAAIAIPLALTSSGSSSDSPPTLSSEGYGFTNPLNGAKGADPLFINAQQGDWAICARAYQVVMDFAIAGNYQTYEGTLNASQISNDVANFNEAQAADQGNSLTVMYLKVGWEIGASPYYQGGQYTGAYNMLITPFTKGCTGSPYTWS